METQEGAARKSPRRKAPRHDVKTKCEAVLAVWSERRRPAEICRELGIHGAALSAWQNRALEGILQALAPPPARAQKPLALSPRLERRLARRMALSAARAGRVQQRLKAVERNATAPEQLKE
ncbi:MAG: transposase [Lentisphaerae bacterium]|nr:transposase [Lentisphaerota bacterium]